MNILLYLNKEILFDLVATHADGITEFEDFLESASSTKAIDGNIDGSAGIPILKNIVKAEVTAKISGDATSEKQGERTFRKLHTEGSMFNKLISDLTADNKIKKFNDINYPDVAEGDLIEYTGVLSENPFISQINALNGMLKLLETIDPNQFKPPQKRKNEPQTDNPMLTAKKLIEHFAFFDDESAHKLIVSKSDENEQIAAFLIENKYLRGRKSKDLAGGKYTVFGKVIRKHSNGFDLLNSTSLSLTDNSITDDILSSLAMEGAEGFTHKAIQRYLDNDTIEIFPIALFV